jgi:HSP20 family protein
MTALTHFEPIKEFAQLQDAMSQFFDDRVGRWPWRESQDLSAWAPAVDVYEDAEQMRLTAELPGLDPKEVDIRIENGLLTLRGERKLEKEEKQENYHRIETRYGSFVRSFALPNYVDTDKVRAEFKNGLLNVFLPKREESKPKQIKVKVEG